MTFRYVCRKLEKHRAKLARRFAATRSGQDEGRTPQRVLERRIRQLSDAIDVLESMGDEGNIGEEAGQ